jgi:hypothetical protein
MIDPTKLVVHHADPDKTVPEIEEYDEWRLTILSDDAEPCICIARGQEQLDELLDICRGNLIPEQDAITMAQRHVVTTRTAWTEVEPPTLDKD